MFSKVWRFLAAQSALNMMLISTHVSSLEREARAPEGRPCLKRTKAGEKTRGFT